MNPRILRLHVKAHHEWIKEQDYLAWLQGRYIHHALSVVLSHFGNKHSKAEYPNEPYMEKAKSEEEKARAMDEQKKQKLAENYMLRLQLMASNWNRNNKDKENENKSGSVS